MQIKQVSYVKEMLYSQGNMFAVLGTVAASVLISIPYGFNAALIPLIGLVAGETIAAMFIPYSENFRAAVDKKYREQERAASRQHFLEEIHKLEGIAFKVFGSMDAYQRMLQHVASLYQYASDSRTSLSMNDVEKLDDATLDYLSMWLALTVIEERANSVNMKEVETRLERIDQDLADIKPGMDQLQLQKARNDYLSLITRQRRMLSRKAAIEAAIISMPDQMDEIYQTIMTAPTSSDVDSKLAESIAKLGLEEDLEAELEGALRDTMPVISQELENRKQSRVAAGVKVQPQAQKNTQ
ncbi:hypothetical protein [Undibacterium sp. Tian12W]|uniref:hypothetical protein n=1 Tax=Undibacterium sp. Tian12W TaxID=3413054 RepID=UPI003BEF75B5